MKTLFVAFLLIIGFLSKAQVNKQDSLALVDLYDSAGGSNWTNNTNWLTSAPVGSWYGIGVSAGRVISIYMNYNFLTGSIPSSLGNLTSLTSLQMFQNYLKGSIPSSLGNLTHLTDLDLPSNQLSGTIPSSLGNLKSLYLLLLNDNKLSGSIPSSLGNLTNLTHFWLEDNEFTFNGMEGIVNLSQYSNIYSPQETIPLINTNNTLSVSVGGTPANNTFSWYRNGKLVATKVGDSTYTAITRGVYSVIASNSIATQLILHSDLLFINDTIVPKINSVTLGCTGGQIGIKLNQPMHCKSIASDGSDFSITPTHPVVDSIIGFGCAIDTLMDSITIFFATPFETGFYQLNTQVGKDGNTIVDTFNQSISPGEIFPFVRAIVDANFVTKVKYGCQKDTVAYIANNNFSSIDKWYWNFDGTIDSTTHDTSIVYTDFSTKQVQLIVSYGFCSETSKATLTLPNEGEVKAGFVIEKQDGATIQSTDFICPTEMANLKDISTGNVTSWYWDFGNNQTSTSESPNLPAYQFTDSINTYTVKLIVKNDYCSDTQYNVFKVIPNCYVGVPSAFTPSDNKNNFLSPLNAWKADKLEFRVFDRYGRIVFESHEPTQKWDGRINGTVPIVGTYVWMLTYIDHDTKKRISQQGTTVLLK